MKDVPTRRFELSRSNLEDHLHRVSRVRPDDDGTLPGPDLFSQLRAADEIVHKVPDVVGVRHDGDGSVREGLGHHVSDGVVLSRAAPGGCSAARKNRECISKK